MRYLLAPISWLFALALRIRHWLYDEHLLPSFSVSIPTICVGNLAVGGTGKTPHVEYIVRLLSPKYKVAVLSRGYGRLTRGFMLADENSTATTIGDEPMQIHCHFPEITVAVCEDRVRGVRRLEKLIPDLDVVILDDAFQHRRIRAGLKVLLTEYNHLYVNDHLLPVGRLRDLPSRSIKADIVAVTKCPADMKPIDCRVVSNQLKLAAFQHLVFSHIEYDDLPLPGTPLVVTGIASAEMMLDYVRSLAPNAGHIAYGDHHVFTADDVQHIVAESARYDYVLTTEKDYARMLQTELPNLLSSRLATLPIRMVADEEFDLLLQRYVAESKRKKQNKQIIRLSL